MCRVTPGVHPPYAQEGLYTTVPENVAISEGIESQESPVEETEAEATPSTEDVATLKKRLAGKDQALTRIQQERDAYKAERESLSRWKAEREETDLTEVEKLQRRVAEYEARATEAEAKAERVRLERLYPLAVDAFGDDPLPAESRLEALQERLAATSATGAEAQPEPRVDPNRPRRSPSSGKSVDEQSGDELANSLTKMGNPFYDSVFG